VKNKNMSSIPRCKKYSREQRIFAAKSWIEKYNGKNVVKGYSKYFAVDLFCAVKELEIIGIKIEPEYIEQLKNQRLFLNKTPKISKKELKLEDNYIDSDANFQFIAGYTSGGVPYGITWEESRKELIEKNNKNNCD
jgi:hypothetical protein